ncbi:Pepco domain-containing protein [Streptomyces tauricus]|uniref:Pepco domain-containing protein n=1 Tax=Streptomyces tauricus TaxID=68274 RepID=UPI002243A189|nr:hypothetical protein [Streptomyces tauricus]MCW8099509.1 hypothetical protein [Streptomyces tauricus]
MSIHNEPMVGLTGLDIVVKAEANQLPQPAQDDFGRKGFGRPGRSSEFTTVTVRSEQLRDNLERTVDTLKDMFERIASSGGKFPLKEVQVSFEISAKGGIRLIGSSEVEGKGGITLIFGTREQGE